MNYKQDQKVHFDINGLKGVGKIVGKSTENQFGGDVYIIEPEISIKSETYPYTHITCCETHIKSIEQYNMINKIMIGDRKDSPHHYTNRED
jgi:hypothetical protein